MNERIRQLAVQATVFVADYDGQRWQIDPEKFAELIVQECAWTVRMTEFGDRMTQEQIARHIEDHFRS